MRDFFISYNKADCRWAEWIGWQLEEQDFTVFLQHWDFRPGSNFVLEMQKASTQAERTIAVLSLDYLTALYTQPEWAAAFSDDPIGSRKKLLPVRVHECQLQGMLKNIVYIDLVGLSESDAQQALIAGIKTERAKPLEAPAFPGEALARTIPAKPGFPPVISISKLPTTGKDLFGRKKELEILNQAWSDPHTHIVTLVAWGGVGKTALVNHWLNMIERQDYCGAQRVYGWSFYSQGAEEGKQASADEFMQTTLAWFGDQDPTAGSGVEKGRRLAHLIRKAQTLLILDGMEPLQYPPGELHGFDGLLKDQGLKTLLKELAASHPGLCVITTREPVTDLADRVDHTVKEILLEHLSEEAGAQLLKNLEVTGSEKEILEAVQEYDGHALALNLLGNYLHSVHQGDIRKRDKIPPLTKDRKKGRHARRVMEAYERWLGDSAELNIMSIMGLFDQPVEKGAVEALKGESPIIGITQQLQELSEEDWQWALTNLRTANLLSKADPQKPGTLDCHPLIREHFGEKLREENPDGWKQAHTRLYHYYKNLPEKELPDTLPEMEPLFAAVAHGCAAGLHQEAENDVFWQRIRRGEEAYTVLKFGAFGADLEALSHFFQVPWSQLAASLTVESKAFILHEAGFGLRAVGRLQEAIQPMKAGLGISIKQENWEESARHTVNLSQLVLTLGRVEEAVDYARQAVTHADNSGDDFLKEAMRTALADALQQRGELGEAEKWFREAEAMQKKSQPEYHYLYGLQGFLFCELLLRKGRHQEVRERVEDTIKIAQINGWLLAIALDTLSLGRVRMMQILTEKTGDFTKAREYLHQAVAGLRKAGRDDYLPRSLFSRAECFRYQQKFKEAWEDLQEALEIAQLGGMKLFLADYHLEAGKLCEAQGKQQDARKHFTTAKEMMKEMGYGRKLKEVEEALGGLG
ncbi:MAG: TIR domain-containing protein [Candidatus Aminicenantes bacterium]|jgi:tetratricopeptide (TPR) repeat protein